MPIRRIAGSVDHVTSYADAGSIATNINQIMYVNMFKFLNGPCTASNITQLVAYLSGNLGSGSGIGYWDTPGNVTGENAFAVFKFPSGSSYNGRRKYDFYLMIQWAGTSGFGVLSGSQGFLSSASLPGTSNVNRYGIAIAGAWMPDGTSPWNGTTLANGQDRKGNPVWKSGSINIIRSNNPGNSHGVTKDNMIRMFGSTSTSTELYYHHFVADNDSFYFGIDFNQSTRQNYFTLVGAYEPIPVLSTSVNMPVYFFSANQGAPSASPSNSALVGSFDNTVQYGTTTGNNSNEGSVQGPVTDISPQITPDYYSYLTNISAGPNGQVGSGTYDILQCYLLSWASAYGLVGNTDPYYLMHVNAPHRMKISSSINGVEYAVLGNESRPKMLVPWSGSQPGTSFTRAGRQFFYTVTT